MCWSPVGSSSSSSSSGRHDGSISWTASDGVENAGDKHVESQCCARLWMQATQKTLQTVLQ
jgi:hypothetical protein